MGLGFLFLTLFSSLTPLVSSQEPNSDGFFVSDFLQKMGSNISGNHSDKAIPSSHCSWRGVFCDPTGQTYDIVKLEFSNLGLSGVIPENTVGKMVHLQHLDLSSNQITSLPDDFWSLSSLTHLDLSFNRFTRELPNNIGNFAKLQVLDLSHNNYSGKIPESIGALTSLMALNLSNNMFDSVVPSEILQCSLLASIDLAGNRINGSVPSGFGAAFPVLRFLNLSGNGISGGPDSDLFEDGSFGVFAGSIEAIDLSRNQFEGSIGQLTSNLSNLVYLDVSENRFSGEFLVDFSRTVNLKHLNIARNRFSKQRFLAGVIVLSNLEYLNLSGASLVGSVPGEISSLSGMSVLDLSNNDLTGQIPSTLLERLHGMKSYNFSNNHLSVCPSGFSKDALAASFKGLVNACPIAADPRLLRRNNNSKRKGLKLGLVLSFSLVSLLVLLLFLALRHSQRKNRMWAVRHVLYEEECSIDSTTWATNTKQAASPVPSDGKQEVSSAPVVIFEKPLLNFTYADLVSATHNFDRCMLLAEGWFGPVYKALLPGGGVWAAIKVLVHGSTMPQREAARELDYLGRIKHPNLVSLTGYCLVGDKKIVIYEYMDNGNLQNLLYDPPDGVEAMGDENNTVGTKGLLMSWIFRYKILLNTARSLAFLHHGCSPPIIHQDVKASSVYLDYNLEPRLSHFGLGKIFGMNTPKDDSEEDIVRGPPGYMAPELLDPENASPSTKSDVYAYGVILFELLTVQKPGGDGYSGEKGSNLVSWVREVVRRNDGSRVIDPKIHGKGPEEKMAEALKIGYLCTAEVPSKRPSMQQVVGLLKDLEPITEQ